MQTPRLISFGFNLLGCIALLPGRVRTSLAGDPSTDSGDRHGDSNVSPRAAATPDK